MKKYIQDFIWNQLKSLLKEWFSLPQEKAIREITRGLLKENTPVLRLLSQDPSKQAKYQWMRFSKHLWNICLEKKVETYCFKKSFKNLTKDSIIAYDLWDINKDSARKMWWLSKVMDGSKRRVCIWYVLYGVCLNGFPIKMWIQNKNNENQNELRKRIVDEVKIKCWDKWIYVFDRGNDKVSFMNYLNDDLAVRYIIRLKRNRNIVLKWESQKRKITELKPGKYIVHFMKPNSSKVNYEKSYTVVVNHDFKSKHPIILLTNLDTNRYENKQITDFYLNRWWIEKIYKRMKTKFGMEKIRLLKIKKVENLIYLIQFLIALTKDFYNKIVCINSLIYSGIQLFFKHFLKKKNLYSNVDSFISFLKENTDFLIFRKKVKSQQLDIFHCKGIKKMPPF